MNVFPTLPLIVALVGQAPPPPSPDRPEEAPARLEYMKKAATSVTIHPTGDRSKLFRLLPEPIIRFNNPVGRSRDGTIFLWLGAHDRPEVADQINVNRTASWKHQFSSLSTGPLVAETRSGSLWSPRRGGVEYQLTVSDRIIPSVSFDDQIQHQLGLRRLGSLAT